MKKTKTSEKHKEKDAKTEKIIKAEKVSKKDTEKPIKKESKKDTKKDIKKETEKGSNKNSKKKIKKLIKPEHPQGKPFEGIIKTKKRNMRRRLLKKSLRDVPISNTHYITPAPAIITSDPELQVEKLNISEPTSTHLFKQNKNKNKHHLKKASKVAETQSHVHYLDKPVDSVETVKETNHGNHVNHYGRAFVTLTESEPQCQGRRGPVHEYPIHRVPTLFYAEKAMEHEPQVPQAEIQQPEAEYQPIMSSSSVSVPVDYDSYPDVDFIKNIPSIGTHLAIKVRKIIRGTTCNLIVIFRH